jgi:ribonuclease BN (tRNA processing enzyme)
MRVTLIPSSLIGGNPASQFLTSVLINDAVCLDAGCIGFHGSPAEQERVRHVLLTHSHLDHVASLPIFLNNILGSPDSLVTVHAGEVVLDCLQRDVFNDRIWPDFLRISAEGRPFLRFQRIDAGSAFEIEGLRITPIAVNHVVPTTGFLVEEGDRAVLFSGDTGPTEELWQVANRTPGLRAVFLDVTFPNEQQWLAEVAKHLTPAQFGQEMDKVDRPVRFIAVHIHPREEDRVVQELNALGRPNVEIGRFGVPYEF